MPPKISRFLFPLLLASLPILAMTPQELVTLRILPHSGRGEGLDYHQGILWEAEGHGKLIRKINPITGNVQKSFSSPTLYPESLVWMEPTKFLHIDFKRRDVVLGRIDKHQRMRFELLGELAALGFGMAKKDARSFWVSEYFSPRISLYSYPQLKRLKTISTSLAAVEDLAWDGVHLWASDYHDRGKRTIYRINHESGRTVGVYRLPGPLSCDRVDGIAFNGEEMYVTGKKCPLYVVRKPR